MIIEKQELEGATLLRVEGVIKLGQSASFFADALQRVLEEEGGHVVIDLSRINMIDSTGIGELVGYLARFRDRSRELILVNPSDRIRKQLAGIDPETSARAEFGEGIYTPEWNDRTYTACLREAEARLLDGGRVVVDASFREAARRSAFLDVAVSCGVRSVWFGERLRR